MKEICEQAGGQTDRRMRTQRLRKSLFNMYQHFIEIGQQRAWCIHKRSRTEMREWWLHPLHPVYPDISRSPSPHSCTCRRCSCTQTVCVGRSLISNYQPNRPSLSYFFLFGVKAERMGNCGLRAWLSHTHTLGCKVIKAISISTQTGCVHAICFLWSQWLCTFFCFYKLMQINTR